MDKEDVIYIYVYVCVCVCVFTMDYSAYKKNGILPLATTWLDLEGVILSEVSQAEKDKHHMMSLICGI